MTGERVQEIWSEGNTSVLLGGAYSRRSIDIAIKYELLFMTEGGEGFALCSQPQTHRFAIVRLAVQEKSRGKGLGPSLVWQVVSKAASRGCTSVEVRIQGVMTSAIRSLQREGFKQVARLRKRSLVGHDLVIMQYLLTEKSYIPQGPRQTEQDKKVFEKNFLKSTQKKLLLDNLRRGCGEEDFVAWQSELRRYDLRSEFTS